MKRKVVQKLMAASLATVMAVSAAGCGDAATTTTDSGTSDAGTTTTDSTTTESSDAGEVTPTEEPEEVSKYTVLTDENGEVYDLGGMEIIIRDWWTADEEVETKNEYEEAREEYYDWIQETYNFTIKQVAVSSWSSTPEDFLNYATTGGEENYLFILRSGSELVSAMNSGLMYDLSTLDCLDFSEDKWGSKVHELMGKGTAIYGMCGISSEPRGGMFFNKRLLEEAGIDPDTIYDLQESGEWTWDKFEEICSQVQADTDNDGVIDRYAMVNFAQSFYCEAVASNYGEFIGKDENGLYYNDLESEETIEALNWALTMLSTYDYPQPEGTEWDYWKEAFVNGNGAFIAGEAYQAGQDWVNMEDDFGFVCFPKGPKADDYTNVLNDNPYCIPACYDADKAWKIAFAYNLYTEPIPGFEDYNDRESGYFDSMRDTESVEYTVNRLMNNGTITYHNMIPSLALGSDVLWGLNADNTAAQAAEAIRNTWASYIEEANK